MGHIIKEIGPVGDLELETKLMLKEYKLYTEDFDSKALQWAEEIYTNWKIPEEEFKKRLDLRSTHTIFTIDPVTAKDLDDAISYKIVDESN